MLITKAQPKLHGVQGQTWGRWVLDLERYPTLNIALTEYYVYELHLADCVSFDGRKLALQHMAEKRKELISDRDLFMLNRALSGIFDSPLVPQELYQR